MSAFFEMGGFSRECTVKENSELATAACQKNLFTIQEEEQKREKQEEFQVMEGRGLREGGREGENHTLVTSVLVSH